MLKVEPSELKSFNTFRLPKYGGWVFAVPFCLTLLVYSLTASAGLTWQHGGDDGGDLVMAVSLWGIPHPTGYPLYIMVSKPFLLLSSDPARALALASTLWGSLTCGLLAYATYRLSRAALNSSDQKMLNPIMPAICGVIAGLMAGFGPLLWSQATIVEVYSFGMLLQAGLLVLLVRWWESRNASWLVWLSLLAGLAVGHHRTAIFSVIAGLVFIGLVAEVKPSRKWLKYGGLFVLALALPYLYTLFRGGAVAASNWSNPGWDNFFDGFWGYVTGSDYSHLVLAAPISQSFGRIVTSIMLLQEELGIVGLLLGAAGLSYLWLGYYLLRPWLALVVTGVLLHMLWAAIYAADNSQVYLLPMFALWAVVAGCQLGAWVVGLPKRGWQVVTLIFVLLVGPCLNLITNYAASDLSRNQDAAVWTKATLEAAPSQAVLVTDRDDATFALWYGQNVQDSRPDVAIIESRLLNRNWYRQNLARQYPNLQVPDNAAALATTNPTRPVIVVRTNR